MSSPDDLVESGSLGTVGCSLSRARKHFAVGSRYGRRPYSTPNPYLYPTFFFFFSRTSTFQLPARPWSQVSSLFPPVSRFQFLARIGFGNPTARRFFIECCSLTLSRFPQVNLCRRKSPHEYIRVCTRGDSHSRN